MMIKKRILCILMFFSYLLLSFILIYFNKINPDYEGYWGLILSIVVICIWLLGSILLVIDKRNNPIIENNKIDNILTILAALPLIVALTIPFLVFLVISFIIDLIKNNIKKKCKVLISKGYILVKEKQDKAKIIYLKKGNVIVRFREFDDYEVSVDNGLNYIDLRKASLIPYNERQEIDNLIYKYKSCDYRDKDLYEPTEKILIIISKYL